MYFVRQQSKYKSCNFNYKSKTFDHCLRPRPYVFDFFRLGRLDPRFPMLGRFDLEGSVWPDLKIYIQIYKIDFNEGE